MQFIKNYLFLVSLAAVIILDPFLEDLVFGSLISLCLLSVTAGLCLLVLSFEKSVIRLLIIFSFLIVGFNFILLLNPSCTLSLLQYLSLSIVVFLYAFLLFYLLMTSRTLSIRDISNAISIYLLLGIGFGFLYSFIEKLHPGAFVFQAQESKDIYGDMIYFSIVTLTTAGFGDIHPVHKIAKAVVMTEAVTGVLFIAITIGRLVGIGSGQMKKE